MTIETSTNFKSTKYQIILDAFNLLTLYGIGRSVSAEDMDLASRALNKMLKAWSNKGLHLWCRDESILYLKPGQNKYKIGEGSSDHFALKEEAFLFHADSNSTGSNILSVKEDTSDLVIGNSVGVVLKDGDIFWTKILDLPSSSTIQLEDALPENIDDETIVHVYTQKISKPLKIDSVRRTTLYPTQELSISLAPMPYSQYMQIANRNMEAIPTQYTFNPKVRYTEFYVWPTPKSAADYIEFVAERQIYDLDEASDNFDLPVEWEEAITWQLALRLAPAWGKGKKAREDIMAIASEMLRDLLDGDTETTSLTISVDRGDY